jgi:dTDP-4-amino-4,6-dideoxygalactose transaminase
MIGGASTMSGIGNDLIGDVEDLLLGQVVSSRALFRFDRGAESFAARCEAELARSHDAPGALLLPSASLGLLVILKALGLPAGSRVAVAPFGWIANFSVLELLGLRPHFLRLDADLHVVGESVLDAIDAGAEAVLLVHMMGRAQRATAEIAAACRSRGIPLIEDVAQSYGVRQGGRAVGSSGCAAYSSLNHHKLLSTGDGGFVVVHTTELLEQIRALHDQGCGMVSGKRTAPAAPLPGLSLRVNELTAAVALAQITRFNLIRARVLKRYREVEQMFAGRESVELIRPDDGDIPFTLLFRTKHGREIDYPDLSESGWHSAWNIPYLGACLAAQCAADPRLDEVASRLATTHSIGCGFVDSYYAASLGVPLNADDAARGSLRARLAELL